MNLIEDNQKLVFRISNSFAEKHKGFESDDLAQIGFSTLAKTGHKYDSNRGAVSTFISHCVMNALRKHIKRTSRQKYKNVESLDYIPDTHSELDIEEYFPNKDSMEFRICKMLSEGYNKTEISKKLNTSVWFVHKSIEKIKERLKRDQ